VQVCGVQIPLRNIGSQFVLFTLGQRPKSKRICEIYRIVANIRIEISIATIKFQWVFADKPLELRVVVSGAVEIHIGNVAFAAGIGETVGRARAADAGIAKRIEGISRLHGTRTICES
jgi:hypothetical protein